MLCNVLQKIPPSYLRYFFIILSLLLCRKREILLLSLSPVVWLCKKELLYNVSWMSLEMEKNPGDFITLVRPLGICEQVHFSCTWEISFWWGHFCHFVLPCSMCMNLYISPPVAHLKNSSLWNMRCFAIRKPGKLYKQIHIEHAWKLSLCTLRNN